VLVSTTGDTVGVVNGLSVIQLGEAEFERPTRISASVSLGDGDLIDIEREVKLGLPSTARAC
jgi:predicted ATP-dependent protease